MLITENKFRSVVRQTLKENHYRIDEHFYNDLNRNLMNEGLMDSIKKGAESFKKMFKSKDKKIVKKAAIGSNKILIGLAAMILANAFSHGQVLSKNHTDAINNQIASIEQVIETAVDQQGQSPEDWETSISLITQLQELSEKLLKREIGLNDSSLKELLKLLKQHVKDAKLNHIVTRLDYLADNLNNEDSDAALEDFAIALGKYVAGEADDIDAAYNDAQLDRI